MNLAELVPVVLQVSVAVVVFCVALQAEPGDFGYLLRRPWLLVRSLLAMNVVMPLVAAAIAAVCNLRQEVKIALIVLAVSPVPPVLPNKQAKAGGNVSYGIGLLMLAALVSIVTVPVTIELIGRMFGRTVDLPMIQIARVVGLSVVGPLLLGAVIRMLAPRLSARVAKPLSTVGLLLLLVAFAVIMFKAWPAVVAEIGDFTLVAIVLFTLLALGVGHLMGGPDPEDRTVLALSNACRHPGVAIAIAGAVNPDKGPASAAVLLAVLVSVLVTVPYVKWRQRSVAPAAAAAR